MEKTYSFDSVMEKDAKKNRMVPAKQKYPNDMYDMEDMDDMEQMMFMGQMPAMNPMIMRHQMAVYAMTNMVAMAMHDINALAMDSLNQMYSMNRMAMDSIIYDMYDDMYEDDDMIDME
ncbi:hypothetical protein [Vallitalea sp.]|jgi:hypothetical protein|uniref:hypothetical protein n=1 Tax=Vallitalea sp. TaxID=1882829 RepID=UPI0025DDB5F6|nr:hypothetical protein [Vallitalea sp.]MCT4688118.1 hypothetical protein [Vallitalea sp.]